MAGGENIIKTATSNFGRIDILVNCAGYAKNIPFTEVTEEDWDGLINVHLKGHFACTQPAVKEMIKQKSGRIINFSSRAAVLFKWGLGTMPYTAAKAGILGFTALLSSEMEDHGITVNCILPSAITKGFPEERPKFGGGQMVGPDMLTPIIVYLATDKAAKITGQYFYAAAGDIAIFERPLQLDGTTKFLRKTSKWTIEELEEMIPNLLGLK
jgi:3-oxoacyl-[acyl-carrier protein] reductase